MNDRYLFRAKRKNWRELPKEIWWVEGYYAYFKQNDNHCIYYEVDGFTLVCDIDVSTLCVCTGLKDKNGKMIWENDITLRTSVTGVHKGKIFYGEEGAFCQRDFESLFENLLLNSESYFEVIGNIFDNPELMHE